MKQSQKPKKGGKVRIAEGCYVGEHAVPRVKWVEDADCPLCGGNELMEAKGMALCVSCNKFVRPEKRR